MKYIQSAFLSLLFFLVGFQICHWLGIFTAADCGASPPHAETIVFVLLWAASVAGAHYLRDEL